MARSLTSGMITAVTGDMVAPIFLCDFAFDTETLRFWTGAGTVTWDSVDWIGSGELLSIGQIEETAKIKASGLVFELSGVPSSTISVALNENYQGRTARLFLGAIDSSGIIIVDPYLLFQGFMDVMDMNEDGETAAFQLSVENKLIALERANTHFYTSERQKLDYPNDEGFAQVTELQDKEITWGKK